MKASRGSLAPARALSFWRGGEGDDFFFEVRGVQNDSGVSHGAGPGPDGRSREGGGGVESRVNGTRSWLVSEHFTVFGWTGPDQSTGPYGAALRRRAGNSEEQGRGDGAGGRGALTVESSTCRCTSSCPVAAGCGGPAAPAWGGSAHTSHVAGIAHGQPCQGHATAGRMHAGKAHKSPGLWAPPVAGAALPVPPPQRRG